MRSPRRRPARTPPAAPPPSAAHRCARRRSAAPRPGRWPRAGRGSGRVGRARGSCRTPGVGVGNAWTIRIVRVARAFPRVRRPCTPASATAPPQDDGPSSPPWRRRRATMPTTPTLNRDGRHGTSRCRSANDTIPRRPPPLKRDGLRRWSLPGQAFDPPRGWKRPATQPAAPRACCSSVAFSPSSSFSWRASSSR